MKQRQLWTSRGVLALIALLVSACGSSPDVGLAGPGLQPQATTGVVNRLSAFRYVHTLAGVPATETPSTLKSLYGGQVLVYDPVARTAVLANNSSAKGKYDAAVESNTRVYKVAEQGLAAWSSGYNAWGSGYNAWGSGYNAWGSGTTSSATTFTENIVNWDAIGLSSAQALVPEQGSGIKVAVIDTGIDLNHPGLQGRLDLANGKDYVQGDLDPSEVNGNTDGTYSQGYGHGTAVAGIIAQVAPKATILALRVLDPFGEGDVATVADAINYAVLKGAKVINLSLGSNADVKALNTAVSAAIGKGIVVVAAAGNSGDTNVLFPAAPADYLTGSQGQGSVGVGSVTGTFLKSSFSTYGHHLELTAPGERIRTLFPGGNVVDATGTSFAAPVVSGILALALSTGLNITESSGAKALMGNLNSTARPGSDPAYPNGLGFGTVSAFRLVDVYR